MLQLPSESRIAIDEAGRGCLAFDVCAGAVLFPVGSVPEDRDQLKLFEAIKDSKKLTAKKRNELASFIKEYSIAWGIGCASPDEIDQMNILQATFLAMHRAIDQVIDKLGGKHDGIQQIIVDGDKFKPYMAKDSSWILHTCCPGGDNTYIDVAAASILAKTHRDSIVDANLETHPEWKEKYGFDTNKAYGTAKHMNGLSLYGPTEYHRKSFAPVQRLHPLATLDPM